MCPGTGPLELAGEAEQGGLVADARNELHAERKALGGRAQGDGHGRLASGVRQRRERHAPKLIVPPLSPTLSTEREWGTPTVGVSSTSTSRKKWPTARLIFWSSWTFFRCSPEPWVRPMRSMVDATGPKSFTRNGTPLSGPAGSEPIASLRASSNVRVTTALGAPSSRSMLAIAASTSSIARTSPARTRSA